MLNVPLHKQLHRTIGSRLGRIGLSLVLTLLCFAIAAPGIAYAAESAGYGDCSTMHRVKAGETLSSIAAYHGLSLDAMTEANGLDDANYIYEHQMLCVPSRDQHGYGNDRYGKDGYGNDRYGMSGEDEKMDGSVRWSYPDEEEDDDDTYGYNGYGNDRYGDKGYGDKGYGMQGGMMQDSRGMSMTDEEMYGSVRWSYPDEEEDDEDKYGYDYKGYKYKGDGKSYKRGYDSDDYPYGY